MFIERDLTKKIKIFLKRDEYLSIIGPRQSGKTTFLSLLKDYLIKELNVAPERIKFITFEDRKLLWQFEKDARTFVKSYFPESDSKKHYLMIDEFQYARDGGQKLKLIYDTVKNVKIIITGSSSLDIKAKVGKYLVGRILDFYLYPFNFNEFLRAKNPRLQKIVFQKNSQLLKWFLRCKSAPIEKGTDLFSQELLELFEEFCLFGGYPQVVLSKTKQEKQKLLNNIYSNYILKDIKGLLELATENNLFRLSQYLAAQAGNILVYQNLGQVAGLDYRQTKKHLNILGQTYIISLLQPFFKNKQKELSKNPKIYFLDTGLRNSLIDNFSRLNQRSDSGALIENAVFMKLKVIFENSGHINFWRTKIGAEVDFVVRPQDQCVPIEVKFSPFSQEKISRSLASFLKRFEPKKALVLTKDFWGHSKYNQTNILFAPFFYI